jgi:phage terminase large subunit GpA-like protein
VVLWGSPDDDTLWIELDELLKTRWQHPLGGKIGIDAAAIDSGDGDWTQRVYDFCFPRARRRVMAVKGMAGSRPVITATKSKIKGTAGAGRLWLVGVDVIKTTIFNRLQRGRSIRFSASLEAVYYEQLASERKMVRYIRGRPVRRFERISGRKAEALDALVYCFAARQAVAVQLDQRADDLRNAPAVAPPAVVRSAWMSRR